MRAWATMTLAATSGAEGDDHRAEPDERPPPGRGTGGDQHEAQQRTGSALRPARSCAGSIRACRTVGHRTRRVPSTVRPTQPRSASATCADVQPCVNDVAHVAARHSDAARDRDGKHEPGGDVVPDRVTEPGRQRGAGLPDHDDHLRERGRRDERRTDDDEPPDRRGDPQHDGHGADGVRGEPCGEAGRPPGAGRRRRVSAKCGLQTRIAVLTAPSRSRWTSSQGPPGRAGDRGRAARGHEPDADQRVRAQVPGRAAHRAPPTRRAAPPARRRSVGRSAGGPATTLQTATARNARTATTFATPPTRTAVTLPQPSPTTSRYARETCSRAAGRT